MSPTQRTLAHLRKSAAGRWTLREVDVRTAADVHDASIGRSDVCHPSQPIVAPGTSPCVLRGVA